MFGSVMSCSPDGKFLVSLGSGGPGRVWDLTSSTVAASLLKENVRIFFFLKILILRNHPGLIFWWNAEFLN